jgi:hypothetical protein
MMREQDLAAMLFERGVRAGLSMDRVIDELGAINWPSFIDATAFRAALGGAAENQLRRQMEEQLAMIRRKIGGDVSATSMPPLTNMPAAAAPAASSMNAYAQPPQQPSVTFMPEPAPVAASPVSPAPAPVAPAPVAPAPVAPAPVGRVAVEHALPDDDLPTDATMVWLTHHGKRTESG